MADETVTKFNAGASMRGYLYRVRVALLWASLCAGHRVEKEQGVRSKEQGVRSKEQGARGKGQGARSKGR